MKSTLKGPKTFLLVVFVILFVIFTNMLLTTIILNGTLFSTNFFNNTFDKNIKSQNIEKLIYNFTDNLDNFLPLSEKDKEMLKNGTASLELKKQVLEYKTLLKDTIDAQSLAIEAQHLAKGSFAYLTHNSDNLPIVNIKPLKSALVEVFTNQVIANSGQSLKKFETIIKVIEKTSGGIILNGEINEKAVDQFMNNQQFSALEIKREIAEKILEKIGNNQANVLDSKELFEFTVKTLIEDKIEMTEMKDELDLNLLFNKVFNSDVNPVSGFSVMLNDIRDNIFKMNLIILLLLLLIIATIAYKPKSILRWIGIPLIVSGTLFLIPSVLSMFLNKLIIKQFPDLFTQGNQSDFLFLKEWMINYVAQVSTYMLLLSLAIIIIGITLVICAHFIGKGKKVTQDAIDSPTSNTKKIVMVCRVITVVVLVAAISFIMVLYGKAISKHSQEYINIVKTTTNQQEKISLDKILGEMLGANTFDEIVNSKIIK